MDKIIEKLKKQIDKPEISTEEEGRDDKKDQIKISQFDY